MILGIGMDVIEVDRIVAAMKNPRFILRILTPAEIRVYRTPARIAGRWAAKEAIAKAVSIGLTWQQVEILTGPSGEPVAKVRHPDFPLDTRLHLTISHERGIAAAVAILESP